MASDFLQTYAPLANEVANQTGLDPAVVLGIIDTETSAGTRVLSNNIFGISPGGKGGQYVARYPDVQAATQAFITLMQQPRYGKVAAAADPAAQAAALVAAGYNTVDKTYAAKVGSRALQFGKDLGYQPPAAAPAAQPGEDPRMGGLEQRAGGGQPGAAAPAATAAPAPPPAKGEDPRMGDLEKLAATPPPPRTGIAGAVDAAVGAVGAAKDAVVSHFTTPPDPNDSSFNRVLAAGVHGFRDAGTFYTPEFHAQVDQGPVGRFITNPLLDTAKGIAGGLTGALSQGTMEAGMALPIVGGPSAGRDLNALLAVAPVHEAMPGVVRPGGGPVTVGNLLDNIREPWKAPAPIMRSGEPFPPMTAAEQVSEQLGKLSPEQRATLLQQHPEMKAVLDRIDVAEQQAALERQGGGAADVAPETPEQAVARTEADRLEQPGTGGGVGPPTRRAAGAEATTEPIPEKTRAQRIVDLRKDVGQTVRDRADAGRVAGSLRDENVYIEGMPERTEAHTDLSNQAALDHKAMMESGGDTTYKSDHEFNLTQRNEHMGTNIAEPIIGDENTIQFAKEDRKTTTSPEAMGVFRDQKPVDQALLERAHGVFDEQIGSFTKSDPKRAQLERIKSDLFDAGNTPTELRKVRDRLSGVLEDTGASDTQAAQNRALRHHIEEMIKALDPAIESGAPRWGEWRQAWEKASRPINAQEFLQPYGKGAGNKSLWDKEGVITFQRVQRLLEDIQRDHRNPTGKSLGLTDDDIQAFVNMRNELAPGFISDVRSRSRGSPTTKLLEAKGPIGPTSKAQIAGAVAGNLSLAAAQHIAGVHPVLNAAVTGSLGLYQALAPMRKANALRFLEQQKGTYADYLSSHLLNQQGTAQTPYPNPLAPETWPTPAPPP